MRQGLSPLNSWHFLNELLFDSEYPGRGQYYFSHVYGFGAFSDQAAPLLEYDRTYYKNLKNGDEISRHIVEVCADSRAWLLLKAFGEDPKRLCAQELNPTKLCTETLKAAVEDYEFEDLEMAIKLGFKLYFIEGNL